MPTGGRVDEGGPGYGVGGRTDWAGEIYHEQDKHRGGLMREAGWPSTEGWSCPMPAWELLGLDSIGYDGDFVEQTISTSHEFYAAPEPTDVEVGTSFAGPNAVGHEFDATIATIAQMGNFTGTIPEPGPTVIARGVGGVNNNNQRFDFLTYWQDAKGKVINVVDWKRPDGGRILNTGSIASAQTLFSDPLQDVTGPATGLLGMVFRNALHHMGVVWQQTVCAVSTTGQLLMSTFDGTAFGAWQNLGEGFTDSPTGLLWSPNNLGVMAHTQSGELFYTYFAVEGGQPVQQGTNLFGGPVPFVGRPAAVAWGRNRLNIFAREADQHLYEQRWNGQSWLPWRDLGGGFVSDPAAVVYEGLTIGVAAVTTSGAIGYIYSVADTWSPLQETQGPTCFFEPPMDSAPAPALLSWNGSWVSLVGVDTGGMVWTMPYDGSSWRGWFPISPGSAVTTRVALATWGPHQLAVFGANTTNNTDTIKASFWDGSAWRGGFDALGSPSPTSVAEPVAATFRGQTMRVMALGTDGQIHQNVWTPTVAVVEAAGAPSIKVPVGNWSGWSEPAPLLNGSLATSPTIFSWVSS